MKVILKNVRASYVNVFTARAMAEGQEAKYSMQIIMPKDHPQLKELQKAIIETAKEKFPKNVTADGKVKGLKTPLRDGDAEKDEDEYQGMYFFSASSKRRPQVFDRHVAPITEDDNILYSGCYVNVVINTYNFSVSGNKGVAVGLNGVQFLRDGDALGGSTNTANDFEQLDSDDEDVFDI